MIKRLVQIRTGRDALQAALAITGAIVGLALAMTAAATCGGPVDRLLHAILIAAWVSGVIGSLFSYWFVMSLRAILRLKDGMDRLASTDDLTGLHNRRAFLASAERALASARRKGEDLALLILDLDDFKGVNDTYGHPVGDLVLIGVAEILARSVRRQVDVVGRVGGEEFAVLLPGHDQDSARWVAEDIRTAIAAARVRTPAGEIVATASVGCASIASGDSVSTALHRADEALYAAKRGGRNRVAVSAAGTAAILFGDRLDRQRRDTGQEPLKWSA
jgi:diguanylate cyclase (GGDEF)-like protein